jgi:hypothetical protein
VKLTKTEIHENILILKGKARRDAYNLEVLYEAMCRISNMSWGPSCPAASQAAKQALKALR